MPIKQIISETDSEALKVLGENLHACDLLRNKIEECLHDEAPVNIVKGNAVAPGFSEELDELRQIAFSGKDYLDKMVEREVEATGITSLKIASNNVFGYYIEVRNTHKDKVPKTWVRKQPRQVLSVTLPKRLKE